MDSMALGSVQHPQMDAALPFAFEKRMMADREAGMIEADRFFQGRGEIHATLLRLTKHLDEIGVPYAVTGGLAVFLHGLRRLTEKIELLIRREDLAKIQANLKVLDFARESITSDHIRDRKNGVLVMLFVAGDYPGDRRPKPITNPNPDEVCELYDGVGYVKLAALVELKLATGIGGADRWNDLAEVQELIKIRWLPRDYANALHAEVRAAFQTVWDNSRPMPRRFLKIWQPQPETEHELQAMLADGITIEPLPESVSPLIRLVSTDYDIAHKYDMHGEAGFMPPFGTDQDPTPEL